MMCTSKQPGQAAASQPSQQATPHSLPRGDLLARGVQEAPVAWLHQLLQLACCVLCVRQGLRGGGGDGLGLHAECGHPARGLHRGAGSGHTWGNSLLKH